MNTSPVRCPRCQSELPRGTSLCPRCLVDLALASAPPAQGGAPAPAIAELQPLLPAYQLQVLLGRGGMGAVYRARHHKLDRLVAIKVLLPDLVADPAFAERFEREAKALARLDHRGIVGIHDFGRAGAFFYLVMEFVDGASLRDLLAQGRLTARDVLAFVPQLCDALQYAHDHRVVHRDVKPENILIDQEGRVRIADFGLAKLVGTERSAVGLTQTRQAVGTPHYMAPEQIHAAASVDHRADLYSLGVVLYEMLTGELPIGRFQPPSLKAAAPHGFDPVVMRSLENDPAQRYQQAHDVKRDVEAAGTGGGAAAASTGSAPLDSALPPQLPHASAPPPRASERRDLGQHTHGDLPWLHWASAALVLVASFMPWLTIHAAAVRVEGDDTAAMLRNAMLQIGGSHTATAWPSHVANIPCWTGFVLAVVAAILATARAKGHDVPRVMMLLVTGLGLLFTAFIATLCGRSHELDAGIGLALTLLAFAGWLIAELRRPVDASREQHGEHGRRRRRHAHS